MTNEIIVQMCRNSPVQKAWGRLDGDKYVWWRGNQHSPTYAMDCNNRGKQVEKTWIPYQEQLQEIAQKHNKDIGIPIGWFGFAINKGHELKLTFSECYTMAWFLYVNKEVYETEWDWKEMKWKDTSVSEALDHPCATCEHPDCEICQQTGRKN